MHPAQEATRGQPAATRVAAWLAERIPDLQLPLDVTLVAGGRSNLTYALTDQSGRRWVLRRPPTGHLLPTAHDVAREHKIIAALGPAGIPVPPTIGLCADERVIGAPFYVMAFVDGVIARTPAEAERELNLPARRQAGLALAETLAAIHAVDPDAAGLGDLGRRDGYVTRQLRRWYGQYQSSVSSGGPHVPEIDSTHDLLLARIPKTSAPGIVHGDFRIDNTVLDPSGQVNAVLDWELCTIGDPIADVAQFLLTWTEPGELPPLGHAATTAPGFVTRSDLVAHYAVHAGRDLATLDYYRAFAAWKLACILEGVYVRYVSGDMGNTDFDFSFYPNAIAMLASTAQEIAIHFT